MNINRTLIGFHLGPQAHLRRSRPFRLHGPLPPKTLATRRQSGYEPQKEIFIKCNNEIQFLRRSGRTFPHDPPRPSSPTESSRWQLTVREENRRFWFINPSPEFLAGTTNTEKAKNGKQSDRENGYKGWNIRLHTDKTTSMDSARSSRTHPQATWWNLYIYRNTPILYFFFLI